MPSIPSGANPVMLKWARERSGLAIEAVAKAERLSEEILAGWEAGTGTPSYAKLVRLAKRYNRPLMVFYLAEPPTDFQIVNEFRTLPGSEGRNESPAVRNSIYRISERQSWASEFIEESGDSPISFVGSIHSLADVPETALRVRAFLGVSIEEQLACKSPSDAFKLWRSRSEAMGVFVFQAGTLENDGIRGIAFCDKFAPTVAVNTKEVFEARVFTLIHELVHIALGQSAITTFSGRPNRVIERHCDAVAAEVLVPTVDLKERLPSIRGNSFEETADMVAQVYKVSRLAALLKLVDINTITWRELRQKWPSYSAPQMQEKRKQTGRLAPYKATLNRVGHSFTRLAVSAYDAGEIHGAALTELLDGMKLKHVPLLMKTLFPNRLRPRTAVE